MYCRRCGKEIPEDSTFCRHCGADLSQAAPPRARMSEGENVTVDPAGAGPRLPPGVLMSEGENVTVDPGGGAPLESFSRGYRLMNRYEIVCELGRGGMGVVYQAIDHTLGVDVALKTVPRQLRHEERAIANLKREVNTARSLSHEHICRVHDFWECAEAQFISMELIDGPSLDRLLFKRTRKGEEGFPLGQVLEWLGPVCAALDYAHAKKIVHRDLKPGNVMVNQAGVIKVSDFGLARAIHSSMSKFSREPVSGTLLYMSPEQCRGKPTDASSDIYSLGMMTYELLTGQAPFAEAGDIARCQIFEEIEPIPGLPEHANAALAAATAKEKTDRPESASAFLRMLRGVKAGALPVKTGTVPVKTGTVPSPSGTRSLGTVPVFTPGQTRSIDLGGGVKLDMLWIPPGTFTMGSPSSEKDRGYGESQHQVTLTKGFWLGKYEVTQKQWERVMGSNPSKFKGAKNPVEQVSWEDAQAFCQKADNGLRLPSEAEWEYACRAGSTTAYCFGDSDSGLGEYAWYAGNSGNKTHPVGGKKPNAWGLYDMHGNVWEWCQDRYGDYPTGSVTDPMGAASGSGRVDRGGGWNIRPGYCRSAYRGRHSPGDRGRHLGFRAAAPAVR